VIPAEAVLPLPPSVEVTASVVLFCVPVAIAEIFKANVHDTPAARVASDREMLSDPAVAVMVPPPQLPETPLGVVTMRPVGNVSANPIPLRELAVLGLLRAKVSEVVPCKATLAAPNDFEIVGGRMAGGLEDPAEEPPPQAEQPTDPRSVTIEHHQRDVCVGNFRSAPGHHTEGQLLGAVGVNHRNN
jgi:hypothetical protein